MDAVISKAGPRYRGSPQPLPGTLLAVFLQIVKTNDRSDGPQPHKISILFPKRVQIRVYRFFARLIGVD